MNTNSLAEQEQFEVLRDFTGGGLSFKRGDLVELPLSIPRVKVRRMVEQRLVRPAARGNMEEVLAKLDTLSEQVELLTGRLEKLEAKAPKKKVYRTKSSGGTK